MLTAPDLKDRLRGALSDTGEASSDFDLNAGFKVPETKLRDAAVMIGFLPVAGGVDVILTKRSARLKHHPGQIAFPGGKRDDSDNDLEATALREADEEIGLPLDAVDVLGALPPHRTVTSFRVTPIVSWINDPVAFRAEPGEVSEVFQVPATYLLDPDNYRIEGRQWRGQIRKYYIVPFGPYYIWGATARMMRTLAERMSR